MGNLSKMQGNSMHIVYLKKPKTNKTEEKKKIYRPHSIEEKIDVVSKPEATIHFRQQLRNIHTDIVFSQYFKNEYSLYAKNDLEYYSNKPILNICDHLKDNYGIDCRYKSQTVRYAIVKSLERKDDEIYFDFDRFLKRYERLQTQKEIWVKNNNARYNRIAKTIKQILKNKRIELLISKKTVFPDVEKNILVQVLKDYYKKHSCKILLAPTYVTSSLLRQLKDVENCLLVLDVAKFIDSFYA